MLIIDHNLAKFVQICVYYLMNLNYMFRNLAINISTKNRQKKFNYFLEQMHPDKDTKILDVGFTDDDPYPGINFLERNYPYKKNITALGIEDAPTFKKNFPEVKVVLYDGDHFTFRY